MDPPYGRPREDQCVCVCVFNLFFKIDILSSHSIDIEVVHLLDVDVRSTVDHNPGRIPLFITTVRLVVVS